MTGGGDLVTAAPGTKYVIPFVRTSVAKRNIKYLGSSNMEQSTTRHTKFILTFKVSLKRYFINSRPN